MAPARKGPVAGYFRVSKARDDMSAPEIYRGQIKDYAAYKRLELGRIYEDIDFTGRNQDRPGFQRMLREADNYSAIIVPKLSRFGRNARQNLQVYEELEERGVALVFLDLSVDTSTSAGRFMRLIFTGMAEFESDQISDRWRETFQHVARQGRPTGGSNTPYGYRYDPEQKTYVINPEQARVVKEIFRRYESGESLKGIARDLTNRGIPRNGGGIWWTSSLSKMLDCSAYTGLRSLDGEDIEATWKPIIKREHWEALQERRHNERLARVDVGPRKGTGKYMLSGLLYCGKCGATAYKRRWADPGKLPVYICSINLQRGSTVCDGGSIKAHRAEELVRDAFLERMAKPYAQRAKKPKARPKTKKKPVDPMANVEAQITRLVDLAAVGGVAGATVRKKLETLEAQRAQLEVETARGAIDDSFEQERQRMFDDLRGKYNDLPAIWELATDIERRDMLKCVVEEVRIVGVRPKTLEIAWRD